VSCQKQTMLLFIEGLDSIASSFVVSEFGLVLGFVEFGLVIPKLPSQDID